MCFVFIKLICTELFSVHIASICYIPQWQVVANILQVSNVYRVRATDMLYSAMVNVAYLIVTCLLL